MAFIKLDCGLLDSTLWPDREAREVFITALLMAMPREITAPLPQLEVRTLLATGFFVPPGFYGFIAAAGVGIIRRAGLPIEAGLSALERLGGIDAESRSPDWEGRRLVRVDGGFVALNYDKYRQKDHTAAERAKRYRDNKKPGERVSAVTSRVTSRNVTQADADADADAEKTREKNARAPDPDDIGSPATPASHPTTDADHWRMQAQFAPWATALKASGCKIGPLNWRTWSALVDQWTAPTVIATAKGIPATERWPDRVEQTLNASRGQENPGDVVARKTIKVTL